MHDVFKLLRKLGLLMWHGNLTWGGGAKTLHTTQIKEKSQENERYTNDLSPGGSRTIASASAKPGSQCARSHEPGKIA